MDMMYRRNSHLLIASVLVLSACIACTNTGRAVGTAKSGPAHPVSEKDAPNKTTVKPAKRSISGAMDFRDPPFLNLTDTSPRNGDPVFFVALTRLYDRDEEYEFGLRMLARQAAIFREVRVSASTLTVSTGQYEGSREQVEVDYDRDLLDSLYDRIRVLAYYEDNLGTYMKGSLEKGNLPTFRFSRERKNGVPVWVLRMPSFPDYITAVGISERKMFFADSILASEKQAMANMARQFQIDIGKERQDVEIGGLGSVYKQQSMEVSDIKLNGFYVLDRQISDDGNTFYTLAVAPKR